jgi:hypothetical protein
MIYVHVDGPKHINLPHIFCRARAGLKSAGLDWARALHCGLGLLRAWLGLGQA